MTTQRRSRDRRPWWGTGLCALTIAAGACSSGHAETDGTGAASTAAPGPAVVTTVGAPTTAAPTTAAPTTAGAAPDAGAVLHQALDSLTSTYHFVSTVTLDGAVALVADG